MTLHVTALNVTALHLAAPNPKAVDMWSFGVCVYVLLGGYHPFCDSEENQGLVLEHLVLEGRLEFHEDFWGEVSDEAKVNVRQPTVVEVAAQRAKREKVVAFGGRALAD